MDKHKELNTSDSIFHNIAGDDADTNDTGNATMKMATETRNLLQDHSKNDDL